MIYPLQLIAQRRKGIACGMHFGVDSCTDMFSTSRWPSGLEIHAIS